MKNNFTLKIASVILISYFTSSCSYDETINPSQNEPILTNYIHKRFNITNSPNTVIDSINYILNSNKIVSHSGLNSTTQSQHLGYYSYTNDMITKIQSYNNGVLTRIQSFSYTSNENLNEFISESINPFDQSHFFNKHVFTHTTDTIFSSWLTSDDGIVFNVIKDSKIVLDNNNNRTYFEVYDYINEDTKSIVSLYDDNSNITEELYYTRVDGSDFLSFKNTYITNTSENHFNTINETTYGRKSFMLLYHLLPNSVNTINAKAITKNVLMEFNSTWGNSFATFEISNTTNDNNLIVYSDFKTMVEGTIFNRFSQEYIFSNP